MNGRGSGVRRVLVVALEPPLSPLNGLRLPLRHLVAGLVGDLDVRVVAPGHDAADDPVGAALRPVRPPSAGRAADAGDLAAALVRRRPVRAGRVAAGLRSAVRDELDTFAPDVVHVYSGRLAGLAPQMAGHPSVLTALDAWHENVAARAARAAGVRGRVLRSERRRVERFEAATYHRFGRVVTVTPEDADLLRQVDGRIRTAVIPNGVDPDRFAPDPALRPDPSQLVFHGVMDYAPNVTAAETLVRDLLPRVRARHRGAHVAVVGRFPAPPVVRLGQLDGVTVTGEVDQVRPWLVTSRVYVCPMTSGTGIKNKLLEAMAAGLPAVATPLAVQGLDVAHDREVLIGEGPDELATHVASVLDDDALAERLGASARDYVLQHHSWDGHVAAYRQLYAQVAAEVGP